MHVGQCTKLMTLEVAMSPVVAISRLVCDYIFYSPVDIKGVYTFMFFMCFLASFINTISPLPIFFAHCFA